jgi:hypothetical protein
MSIKNVPACKVDKSSHTAQFFIDNPSERRLLAALKSKG